MTIIKHSFLALCLVSSLSILFLITPIGMSRSQNQPTPIFTAEPTNQSTPISTPEPNKVILTDISVDQNIQILKARIDTLEKFVELQSDSYSAAISRTESNTNVILVFMAVASVLVAILGFGIVRLWIGRMVGDYVTKTTSEQIQNATKVEIERIRKEWDPKFAALYEEFRSSLSRR